MCWPFWCQSAKVREASHLPGICRLFKPIDGPTTSVAGPEISMESLILAQDERWRRA